MLTPEQMDMAGEFVATTYRQIEAELIEYLVQKMIEGDIASQRVQTAIHLLAQSMPLDIKKIIDSHADEIEATVKSEVEGLLAASDAFDARIISDSLGLGLAEEALTVQTASVLASAREVLARDNLAMSNNARAKFLQWSTWASTQVATGNMTADKALHKAVRELARGGLSIDSITYKDESGNVTVTNKVDVAVQRHIRTLIAQGSAQLTMQRLEEADMDFVEVSSHIGARPSHCEWHGRCYHIGGAIEVDGVHYEDFEYGTGYRGVSGPYTDLGDQLLGVNCRHSFAPWYPGCPRAYDPDPKSPTGLDNDEIYALTQKQRYRERRIREAKRDLKAAQQLYDANPSPENAAELTKAKNNLRKRQESIRNLIKDSNGKCNPGTEVLTRQPRREWAGDMPKIATKAEISNEIARSYQPIVNNMAADDSPIIWPYKGKKLSKLDRKAIKQYANDRGVSLSLPKHCDANIAVLKTYIDAANDACLRFPELRGSGRKTITIRVAKMDSRDFASSKGRTPHVININEASIRSENRLIEEYGKLVNEGWFVKGTSYKSVIYHEMGHIYGSRNKISGMRVARSIIGAKEKDAVAGRLFTDLSEYASSFDNGREIISEVFSAWMSGIDNKFANEFMRRILPLR